MGHPTIHDMGYVQRACTIAVLFLQTFFQKLIFSDFPKIEDMGVAFLTAQRAVELFFPVDFANYLVSKKINKFLNNMDLLLQTIEWW